MDGKSSLGIKENVAGLLCYVGIWITGLIFYVLEKDSKFVKFHALQSLITFLTLTIVNILIKIPEAIFNFVGLGFIFSVISGIISLIGFIAWITGMIFAYQGKFFKFPIIGDIAEILISKNNP
jgi:uncharacterized membrane protein